MPGYVIIEFMLPGDGFCLIQEDDLCLRDRHFFLGDIVQRHASDHQSGRVMSMSSHCTLQPVCSPEEYANAPPAASQGRSPSHAQNTGGSHLNSPEMQETPQLDQIEVLASRQLSEFTVSARDLRNLQDFQEGDRVIYGNAIGSVAEIQVEVTVRLANGSVVVVEDTGELDVPLYVPGSSSLTLAQRLGPAGYQNSRKKSPTIYSVDDSPRQQDTWFFPGQYVQTKKGNLRRGKWLFGAYDPNIEPRGLVVNVRTVELEVDILFPDYVDGDRSVIITTDDLERGEVKLIDPNQLPARPLAKTLEGAMTELDQKFGCPVRLKDVAASSRHVEGLSIIPRTDTQGFDMNVFHVNSTKSKAIVCWQDGAYSEEETISLVPIIGVDQNDVWPGDKVSLKENEKKHREGILQMNACTVGVVQTVNSAERIARVRWFKDSDIIISLDENNVKQLGSTTLNYGTIGDEISEVSLYDISPYEALEPNIADLALSLSTCASSYPQVSDPWGLVIELCLDGDVILRCLNTPDPYDLRVGPSNMVVVPYENLEEDWDDTDDSQSMEENSEDSSPEPIDVQFEYQGGNRIDIDGDEDAWSTDDDVSDSSIASNCTSHADNNDNELQLSHNIKTLSPTIDSKTSNLSSLGNSSVTPIVAPSAFQILEESPPSQHHYLSHEDIPGTNLAGVIAKQYRILQTSLPEGIFVRSWESRIDLLRILIIGPTGTPYEHAPFMFDIALPDSFPDDPPMVFFHSWDNSFGRINPNLYEDGKVCLSLLGTWPADEKSQGWSKRSTVLQVIVSIIGLILVKEPFYSECICSQLYFKHHTSTHLSQISSLLFSTYNSWSMGSVHKAEQEFLDETGYEVLVGSDASKLASRTYSEKAFIMSKLFVARALSNPPQTFKDVIGWLYRAPAGPRLLRQIIHDYQTSSLGSPEGTAAKAVGNNEVLSEEQDHAGGESWAKATERLSAGALISLKKHMRLLIEYERSVNGETAAQSSTDKDGGK